MAFGYLICCLFTRRLTKEDLARISPKTDEEKTQVELEAKPKKNEEEEGLLQTADVEEQKEVK